MTELQTRASELFNTVKDRAKVEKLAHSIVKYTWEEEGWKYDFFTMNGVLKKVEGFNHRELIEVQF